MATQEKENKGSNRGHDNLIPIKKGERLNPNGRPKGQRNYATIYKEALMKLAEINKTTPEQIEVDMIAKGLSLSRKGDYRFYKDTLDRLHGTATQKTDITTKGDSLNDGESAKSRAQLRAIARQVIKEEHERTSPK